MERLQKMYLNEIFRTKDIIISQQHILLKTDY